MTLSYSLFVRNDDRSGFASTMVVHPTQRDTANPAPPGAARHGSLGVAEHFFSLPRRFAHGCGLRSRHRGQELLGDEDCAVVVFDAVVRRG